MNFINQVVLLGHLTDDPVLRSFPSGSTLTTFDVASNRRYKDQRGQPAKETVYQPCAVWGTLAEWTAEHKKGELVLVSGRLKTNSWEKDGQNHSRNELVCDEVIFLRHPELPAGNQSPARATAEPAMAGSSKDQIPF
jgi:single-strand DNA-binding protein